MLPYRTHQKLVLADKYYLLLPLTVELPGATMVVKNFRCVRSKKYEAM